MMVTPAVTPLLMNRLIPGFNVRKYCGYWIYTTTLINSDLLITRKTVDWITKAIQFNGMGKSCDILNYVCEDESINSVKVDGIDEPVDALIDSGCDACVIKRDVLPDSIKSKIEPWTSSSNLPSSATLSDGSPMKILGRVNLRVSCLGTTWIRKSRAILQSDGSKLGVTFGGKKEKKGCRTDVCPSPYVSVKVNGIEKAISTLVDTGATGSYIKREIVTEPMKSKAIPAHIYSTIASGTKIEEMTGLVSLNITFQGIATCIENVHIASKVDDQLVLGMDWIHQTRAVIQSDGSNIIVSQPKNNERSL